MTTWKLIMLGLAAPLALAALAPEATTAAGGAPLTCAIRATPVADGIRLEAVARASKDLSGTYRLRVSSDGGGNTIAQSGDFAAAAGEENTLSSMVLGGASVEGYEARLTVEWPGGSASRKASGPDGI